jgi:iron complex outermembrane receptor protein
MNRLRSLRLLLVFGTAASASLGICTGPAVGDETKIETVVVTGSLLQRTDRETPSPVTIISRDIIDDSGLTTTSDIIRSLTSDSSGTIPTAFGNGFAAGSSGVALRGLTVNSTLVLINGRRTANYPLADDGERGFVDLNTIPLDAVDRIEVLKDGASSLYGADAIAGVVNIILKNSFDGLEGTAETGGSQDGGGFMKRMSVRAGMGDLGDDRFNGYVDAEYESDDRITVGQRGFPFNTNDLSSIGGIDLNGGQPGQSSGSIYGSVTPGMLTNPADVTTGVPLAGATSIVLAPGGCGPKGTFTTDGSGNQYCEQNLTRYDDDQPREERYGAYAHFAFDAKQNVQIYMDASFFENDVVVDQAPSQIQNGTPHNTNSIALPALLPTGAVNPNDPFAVAGCVEGVTCTDALVNYAFGDIPTKAIYYNHIVRGTLGAVGDWEGWHYDTAAVFAHGWLNSTQDGFINYNQLVNDVVNGTYNFIDPSANSASTRAALAPPLSKVSTTDMDSVDVRITRDVFDLPGGPAQLGFGAEFRHEATFDPDLNPGLQAEGLGLAHTIGARNLWSAFAELGLPFLADDSPVGALEGNISGRFDHYSDFGDTANPKFGLKWTPIPQIAFRGTYSTGFRAPSFSENGSSAAAGFTTYQPPPAFQALHNNDGYVQPYALEQFTTANPTIRPETSKNYTLGSVIQPFIDIPFSATIDYYHIVKDGVITSADPSNALNAYYAGTPIPPGYSITLDNPDPLFPNAPARPLVVSAPYVNADSLTTDGIDLEINGSLQLTDDLKYSADLNITKILQYTFVFPQSPPLNYVGTQSPYITSSGAGTPRVRGSWANTFTYDAFSVTGTLYYVSGLKPFVSDLCGTGCTIYPRIKGDASAFYDFDLTGRYTINDHIELFGGIKNVFDQKPPLDPIDYAGINYNPTYAQDGIIGRFFSIGVTLKD